MALRKGQAKTSTVFGAALRVQRSLFHPCVCRATQVQRKVWQEVRSAQSRQFGGF